MAMNTKDLHKLCGKLREDRFLVVFVYLIGLIDPGGASRG
jgi:hypothetical protein